MDEFVLFLAVYVVVQWPMVVAAAVEEGAGIEEAQVEVKVFGYFSFW